MKKPIFFVGPYYPLFKHLDHEHGVTLTDDELLQIVKIARKLERCVWTQDKEWGTWETECGNIFELTDGTPHQNAMHYCPYCGKPLRRDK